MTSQQWAGIAAAFASGIMIAWVGSIFRAKSVKQTTDDARIVSWAKLLGSLESSMVGICMRLDSVERAVSRIDELNLRVSSMIVSVDEMARRLKEQAEALDEHSKEETAILRSISASGRG